ncbi:MAG: substrate-binding domain-containing protein [Armatimonadetes bacterium]|nr:substrate-binding domain-containing protein [Armatimonadota bacterium]
MTLWVPACVALTAILVGCTPREPVTDTTTSTTAPTPSTKAPATPAPAGKSILFISNANSPFWLAVKAGIEAGAAEFGVPARLELNNEGTVAGQQKLLEQALSQKDELLGVAISALRPDAQGVLDRLKQLKDAGVAVITVDSDCKPEYRQAFIGTNNTEAGVGLGKHAAELLPGGAKVCVFVGDKSAQNAKERQQGFEQGAGSKFSVLETYQDGVEPAKAKSNVETALQAHPDATLMVGLWSYNGPAIADVVQAQGKADKVQVICFDAEPGLLPKLESGQVKCTVVQRPYEFGRQGVKLLKALAAKDQATLDEMLKGKDVIDTGVVVVTQQSYPEFRKYLDEKGLKGS